MYFHDMCDSREGQRLNWQCSGHCDISKSNYRLISTDLLGSAVPRLDQGCFKLLELFREGNENGFSKTCFRWAFGQLSGGTWYVNGPMFPKMSKTFGKPRGLSDGLPKFNSLWFGSGRLGCLGRCSSIALESSELAAPVCVMEILTLKLDLNVLRSRPPQRCKGLPNQFRLNSLGSTSLLRQKTWFLLAFEDKVNPLFQLLEDLWQEISV